MYIANVPYEDMAQSKICPVVILSDSFLVIDCLKMISKPACQSEYTLKEWKYAGLRKPPTVRLSKRIELDCSSFIKKVGSLHPLDIIEIQKRITV